MSMFTVKTSGDVEPLQWDSDEESGHEETPTRVKRARIQRQLTASKKAKCSLDDDDDLELLDMGGGARKQESDCEDLRDNAPAGKSMLPSPCFKVVASSKPAPPRAVKLDPVFQQQSLKLRARLAQLKREAEEAAQLSLSESDEDEAGPSGRGGEPAQAPADEVRITLKVKSAAKPEGLKMRIGMSQLFSRLYTVYEQAGTKDGWLPFGAKVTLLFDGDKVDPDDTPASLDLEGDEVIDARW